MSPETQPNASEGASFDERLARLEAIVTELENGGLALEPAIDRYQEGVELLRGCHAVLARYKKRVEELSASALECRDYDGDPDEPARPTRE